MRAPACGKFIELRDLGFETLVKNVMTREQAHKKVRLPAGALRLPTSDSAAVSRLNFHIVPALFSLFTQVHDGNVVSAYRGTSPGPSLDRQTPALGLPFCRKVMVAGGGHGCIVSSIPEPRQGHSLLKTGPLPSCFCVKSRRVV